MLVEIKSSKFEQVFDLEAGETAAFYKDAIFDPDEGKLLALILHKSLFSKDKAIMANDLKISPNSIAIQNKNSIVLLDDLPKIKKLIKNNTTVLHQRVLTKSKKYLGHCESVFVETDGFYIVKIVVKKTPTLSSLLPNISDGLIIPRNQILKIAPKQIIIKDEFAKGLSNNPNQITKTETVKQI